MTAPDPIDLGAMLKRLNLPIVARVLPELEARAATDGWTHPEFLVQLVAEECSPSEPSVPLGFVL
jgi:hypothetical protein